MKSDKDTNSMSYKNLEEIKIEVDKIFHQLSQIHLGKIELSNVTGSKFKFKGEIATVAIDIYTAYLNNEIIGRAWASGFEVKAKRGNIINDGQFKVIEIEIEKT